MAKKNYTQELTPELLAEFAKLKEQTFKMFDESIPANKERLEKARKAAVHEQWRRRSFELGVEQAKYEEEQAKNYGSL